MAPNDSILLKCHDCLLSGRQALYWDRAAAAECMQQREEIKLHDAEGECAKVKLAAQQTYIFQLETHLGEAVQRMAVKFRTPASEAAYRDPVVAIMIDRACDDLVPKDLSINGSSTWDCGGGSIKLGPSQSSANRQRHIWRRLIRPTPLQSSCEVAHTFSWNRPTTDMLLPGWRSMLSRTWGS